MRDVFAPNGGTLAKRFAQYLSDGGRDVRSLFDDEQTEQAFWDVPDPVLSVYDHCELLKQAERVSGDPHVGVSFGNTCDLREAGLIGYTMRTCATLEDACTALARWSGTFMAQPVENAGESSGHLIGLSWTYGGHAKLDLRHWAEFTAVLLVMNFSELTEHAVQPVRVEFVHEAEAGKSIPDLMHGVELYFGCSQNRIVYAERDAQSRLKTYDPQLSGILTDYAKLLQSQDPADTQLLSISVERIIIDRLADGDASLANVSELLGMSQRTLSRRLTAEDTSFFEILERVRKSLALRYLSTREKPLSEISFLLGYSSLSSFNDAFRRWTGNSPGSYRTKITSSR